MCTLYVYMHMRCPHRSQHDQCVVLSSIAHMCGLLADTHPLFGCVVCAWCVWHVLCPAASVWELFGGSVVRSLCLPEILLRMLANVRLHCDLFQRLSGMSLRHTVLYECIQIARTPKDSLAETQIQNYFWVLVRVSYGRRGPAVIVVLTPDKRCAAVRVL